MKYCKTFLIEFYLLFGILISTSAQTVFPVHVSGTLIPPHSLVLADYGGDRSQDIIFTVTLNDPVDVSRDIYFRITVKNNGREIMMTDPNYVPMPMTIFQFSPELITGSELATYLDFNRMISLNGGTPSNLLPEGFNQICLEVMDVQRDIPISKQACVGGLFQRIEVPMLNLPACGEELQLSSSQNLLFQWLPRHIGLPNAPPLVEYEFTLVELLPGIQDPNDGFNSAIQIYQTTVFTPSLLYTEGEPLLEPFKNYAWRVQAKDPMGSDIFLNEGFSQICTFSYGSNGDDDQQAPPNCEANIVDYGPVNSSGIPGTMVVGETVNLGFFEMGIDNIEGLSNGYNGKGWIDVPFLKNRLKVDFKGVKLNEHGRVTQVERIVTKMDAPINIPQNGYTKQSLSNAVNQGLIDQLVNFITEERTVFTQGQPKETPIGLPLTFEKILTIDPSITVLEIEFTERTAVLSAVGRKRIVIDGKEEHLDFAGVDIPINPNGIAQSGTLELLNGYEIELDNKDRYQIFAGGNSTLSLNCLGFDEFNLDGSYIFDLNNLVEIDNPFQKVRAKFTSQTRDLSNFIASIEDLPNVELPKMPGYVFNLNKGELDLSMSENIEGLQPIKNYEAEITTGWRGILFKEVEMKLPESMNFGAQLTLPSLNSDNSLYDMKGLYSNLKAQFLLKLEEGRVHDWPFSINLLSVVVTESELDNSSLIGKIKVPILDTPIDYVGTMTVNSNQGPSLVLKLDTLHTQNGMSLWNAMIEFDDKNEINIVSREINGNLTLIPGASLSGKISLAIDPDTFKEKMRGDKEARLKRVRTALGYEEGEAIDLSFDKIGIEGLVIDPLLPFEERYELESFEKDRKVRIGVKEFPLNSMGLISEIEDNKELLGLNLIVKSDENLISITIWAIKDGDGYLLESIEIETSIFDCDCASIELKEGSGGMLPYDEMGITYHHGPNVGGYEGEDGLNSDFAGFTYDGSTLTISYLGDLKLNINNDGNKITAKTKTLAGQDVGNIQLDKQGLIPGLNLNGFTVSNSFMSDLGQHNSNFTGDLPYDITELIPNFLAAYYNETDNPFPDNAKLLLAGFEVEKDAEAALAKLLLVVDQEDSDDYLVFGAGEVKLKPNLVGFEHLYLYLLHDLENTSDSRLPFTYKKSYSNEADEGSYAYIKCEGFMHYNVQSQYLAPYGVENGSTGCFASYTSDTKIYQMRPPEDIQADQEEQGSGESSCRAMLTRQLTVPFTINGNNLESFIAKIGVLKDDMPFIINQFDVAFFYINEGYVDYSDSEEGWASETDKPTNLVSNKFKGLYFKKLDMCLIGIMQGTAEGNDRTPRRIPIENFGYTNSNGIYGSVEKTDVVEEGDIGGWDVKIDLLKFGMDANIARTDFNTDILKGVTWDNNSPNSAVVMQGQIRLPIVDNTEENFMKFDMGLTFSIGSNAPLAYMFIKESEQGKGFDMGMWKAKMFLCTDKSTPAAQITMELGNESKGNYFFESEFEPYADMNGYFEFDFSPSDPDPETGLPDPESFNPGFFLPKLTFEGFKINNPEKQSDCTAESAVIKGVKNLTVKAFGFTVNPLHSTCNVNLNGSLADNNNNSNNDNEESEDDKKDKKPGFQGLPFSLSDIKFNCVVGDDEKAAYKISFFLQINLIGKPEEGKNYVFKSGSDDENKDEEKTNDSQTKSDTELVASGVFGIVGKPTEDGKQFELDKFVVEAITVDAAYKFFELKGGFVCFNKDAVYGTGLKGYIGAKFGRGFAAAIEFDVLFQTGKTFYNDAISNVGPDEYYYFFIDGQFIATHGVLLKPPVFFHGLGGGFRYNMVPEDNFPDDESYAAFMVNQGQKNVGEPDYDSAILPKGHSLEDELRPGQSLSGTVYKPRPSTLGFSAKTVLSINNGGQLAWGDLEVGMTFTTDKFAIYSIDAVANIYLKVQKEDGSPGDVGDTDNAAGTGTATAQVNFEKGFASLVANFQYSYPPPSQSSGGGFSLDADGNGYLLFLFKDAAEGTGLPIAEEGEWQIKMGTPIEPGLKMELKFNDITLREMGAYFQAGHALDPMPRISEVVPEWDTEDAMQPREGNSSINWAQGNGVAFGANFKIPDKTYEFLIFRARIYAGAGFDVGLQHYEPEFVKNLGCGDPDGNFGINNWYAKGQAYGYFRGVLEMNIDLFFYQGWFTLFDVYAAAVLQAELPNPTWMRAMIKGRFSVLNGAITGDVNFKLEVGERCSDSGNPVASFPVIEDVVPVNEGEDVNIFQNPAVSFSIPIEKIITITEYDDDGSSTVRTFKPYLKDITLNEKEGGNNANGTITYAEDWYSASLELEELLQPKTDYQLRVRVGWKENEGSGWKDFLYNDEIYYEERNISFKTGPRPDVIVKEALDYQAPGFRQRYWHKHYAVPELVFKHEGWDYLFAENSTKLKEVMKEQDKDTDGIPDDIPLIYTLQVTEYDTEGNHSNSYSFPLGKYPGSDGIKEVAVVTFFQFRSFKIPYVEIQNTSGKVVEYTQLNNIDLIKKGLYELEISRSPAPGYLSSATTSQSEGDVQLTGGSINSEDGSLTRKVTNLEPIDQSGSELFKTLYRYEFAVSEYDNLADKLVDVQRLILPGITKDDYGHPEENKMNKLGTITKGKDSYLALKSPESFDEYDQARITKNLKIYSPRLLSGRIYSPWSTMVEKGETIGIGDLDENFYKETSTVKFSLFRKLIPLAAWECHWEDYDPEEWGVGWLTESGSFSFSTEVNQSYGGSMESWLTFTKLMLQPYYETPGWAHKIKFNNDLLTKAKHLTNDEISSKKVKPVEIKNTIEHMDMGNNYWDMALENGSKRILKNQTYLAKSFPFLFNVGINHGDCESESQPYRPTLNEIDGYDLDYAKHITSKWRFPKLNQWQGFTEELSEEDRKYAPYIEIIHREESSSVSPSSPEMEEDEDTKYHVKVTNNQLSIHYLDYINTLEAVGVYDEQDRLIFYWDEDVDEDHEYLFTSSTGQLAFKDINYEPTFKGDGAILGSDISSGTIRARFQDGIFEKTFINSSEEQYLVKNEDATLTDYPLFRAIFNDNDKTFLLEQIVSNETPQILDLTMYRPDHKRLVLMKFKAALGGPSGEVYKNDFTEYLNGVPSQQYPVDIAERYGNIVYNITKRPNAPIFKSKTSIGLIPDVELPEMTYGHEYKIYLKTKDGEEILTLDSNEFWKRSKQTFLQTGFIQQIEACKFVPPPTSND